MRTVQYIEEVQRGEKSLSFFRQTSAPERRVSFTPDGVELLRQLYSAWRGEVMHISYKSMLEARMTAEGRHSQGSEASARANEARTGIVRLGSGSYRLK